MTDQPRDIILANTLADTAMLQQKGYITHALCLRGKGSFRLGNKRHTFASGDCLIIPQQNFLLQQLCESDDLLIEVIFIAQRFIEAATPQSNYGMRGHLALFDDPVMHLTPLQQEVCSVNFDYIRRRLALSRHHFHRDAMLNAVQCMMIDFFDFHAELYGEHHVTTQQALLMQRFLTLLDRGDFRQHRTVGHYASELCVTAKYLSEVCHKVSGQPAIYWITRYTALDISRQLRRRDLTIEEISDSFGFSSVSYFVRYVQKHLGMPPNSFRE